MRVPEIGARSVGPDGIPNRLLPRVPAHFSGVCRLWYCSQSPETTITSTVTKYFIHPSGKLKLLFDLTVPLLLSQFPRNPKPLNETATDPLLLPT